MNKYTLDEILNLIRNRQVNTANIREIVNNLANYNLSEPRVQKIYLELSRTQELPEEIRDWFRDTLRKYQDSINIQIPEEEIITDHNKVIVENQEKINEAEEIHNATLIEKSEQKIKNDKINYMISAITAYAATKGFRVTHDKSTNQISLELTDISKPYIDNMLQKLYKSDTKINVDLERINQTKEELLTIELNEKDLLPNQLEDSIVNMLEEVDDILKDTDREMDYEEKMEPELKGLKDKFVNDDPNVPNENFKVGYSNDGTGKIFYIVAKSEKQAIDMAELMGYDIKKDRGGNVFELETKEKQMEGTKLDNASKNVNEIDEMKDLGISEVDNSKPIGISDVELNYNTKHYDNQEKIDRVINFIEENNTKEGMALIRIEDTQTNNERIITCRNEDGVQEQFVITNGDNFDQHSLPQIIDKFGEGSTFDSSNKRVTDNLDDRVNYEAISNNDIYLYINNYHIEDIKKVDNQLENMEITNKLENSQNSIGTNGYVKTLGTMPIPSNTNNDTGEAAKISPLALVSIILAILLGICIFLTLYFVG